MSHPVPASAPDNECEGKKDGNSWNRMLGTDHSEAVSYMSTTKERMEDIMSYVDDIHDDPVTDTLELCFAETKRAVAMQAGLEAFDAIDVDHDGTLTATEVNDFFTDNPAVLEKITSVKAEQFSTDWARMLQLLDVNNDQSVSRDEFLAFFAENGLGTEHAAVLFDEIDESQDGTLSLHELKRRLQTDTALKATLSGVRMRRLHQEWDAFFAALRDGTSGAVDRTQFASLWCASGLGLNVASAAPATRAASPSPSPPPAAASSQQGSPPALYSRPMTPLTPASGSHGSAVLAPRPPSSCRPSSARPYSSHMSQYLTRDEVWLERPCVKGRVRMLCRAAFCLLSFSFAFAPRVRVFAVPTTLPTSTGELR